MNLANSKTKENLMKAFAGECQARTRDDFAAKVAKKEGYPIIENVFKFVANQELAHAKIFYKFLSEFSGEHISISNADYPVDFYSTTMEFLNASYNNEMEEHDVIYKNFAEVAKQEGFVLISSAFSKIAEIEKIHADKFMKIHEELKTGTFFKKPNKVKWFCTNCGYIHEGEEAPDMCPVCQHPQGYYMLFDEFFKN